MSIFAFLGPTCLVKGIILDELGSISDKLRICDVVSGFSAGTCWTATVYRPKFESHKANLSHLC